MRQQTKFNLSMGYFGKLPSYPDFIGYNAGSREIGELDRWLQEGILKAKNLLKDRWKTAYLNSPRYNFLFALPESNTVMLGVMFPGIDMSQREFPFMAFLIMDRKLLRQIPVFLTPLTLSKQFDLFNESFRHSSEGESLLYFKTEIKKIMLQNPVKEFIDYRKYLLETPLKEFFERTLGSFHNPVKYRIIENLKKYSSDSRLTRSLNPPGRVLIAIDTRREFMKMDMCFTLNLIMSFRAKASLMPAVFWTGSANRIVINIFFNKLTAENYCLLINSQHTEENIEELEETQGKISSETVMMLNDPHMMLCELLENINNNRKKNFKLWPKIKK